ncbi:uncharacterized protein V6R79_018517 [Siganus canaliculatus]
MSGSLLSHFQPPLRSLGASESRRSVRPAALMLPVRVLKALQQHVCRLMVSELKRQPSGPCPAPPQLHFLSGKQPAISPDKPPRDQHRPAAEDRVQQQRTETSSRGQRPAEDRVQQQRTESSSRGQSPAQTSSRGQRPAAEDRDQQQRTETSRDQQQRTQTSSRGQRPAETSSRGQSPAAEDRDQQRPAQTSSRDQHRPAEDRDQHRPAEDRDQQRPAAES